MYLQGQLVWQKVFSICLRTIRKILDYALYLRRYATNQSYTRKPFSFYIFQFGCFVLSLLPSYLYLRPTTTSNLYRSILNLCSSSSSFFLTHSLFYNMASIYNLHSHICVGGNNAMKEYLPHNNQLHFPISTLFSFTYEHQMKHNQISYLLSSFMMGFAKESSA